MQLTPLPSADFLEAAEVRKLIHTKGYFRALSDSWSSALDSLGNHDLVMSALGGLVGHLSRLMVRVISLFLFSFRFLGSLTSPKLAKV